MNEGLNALIWGIGTSAVGLGLAAVVVLLFRRFVIKVIAPALCLSAGVIFSLLLFHLVPESLEVASFWVLVIGVGLGMWVVKVLDHWFHRVIIFTENAERDLLIRSGVFVALGISLHNFPNGIALGALLHSQPNIGLDLAKAMVVHYIPEGLTMALPLVVSRMRISFLVVAYGLAVVPTGIGAWIGSLFGTVSPLFTGLFLAAAIGSILYVATFELLKQGILRLGYVYGIAAALAGGILGVFIV
ncbi:ZIP family metal transporter [Tumebacillus sp. ITR2]|uniref:ZIP family metal transporter n=1 Tax=Tumebacillus amylolyticus TaxID=2801339 RepID=A0ABS1J5K9_9BACL|nr:ZIP family metal transporter [Tumebacillus amylolyticus]MBL0385568.1 ZIP family metal transporter [Tumebacillus amylolyticus]